MTRQQLICALEVDRAGSINRAAQNLFMAQPNLSSTIRELEAEIGITLFKRSSQGVEVTHAGEQFLRQAADIVAQFDALESAYHSRDDSVSLSVTTARSSAISDRIARYLNDVAESGVPFRARICEATNMQVIEDVAAGNADIGILKPNYMTADYYLHTAQLRGLTAVKLRPQPYVLLLSGSHPLAGAAHIMPEQLAPYTEVVHADYDMPIYPYSDYRYSGGRTADRRKNVIFIYDRGTLMEMLSNVHGSYIWTTPTAQALKDAYGLVERPCGAEPIQGCDVILYQTSRRLSLYIQRLIDRIEGEDRAFPTQSEPE